MSLPAGRSFVDHGGVERFEVRARWWLPAPGTLRDVAIVDEARRHRVPELPLSADHAAQPVEGAPVFVGRYWLTGELAPQTRRLACLDDSAAIDGPLVAHRWDGERELDAAGFVRADG